jgi:hypothetical protein
LSAAVEAVGSVEVSKHPKKIMVWAGVSVRGRTRLIFFDPTVNVNQHVYREQVLEGELLRAGEEMFGEDFWTFVQDNSPVHTARANLQWCATFLPNFIEPNEWPPYSPDLNPCDFFLWGTLEAIVNNGPLHSMDELKTKLSHAWENLPQEAVARACRATINRLKQCIHAHGSRFE